jgi:hypothetical protein
MEGAKRRRCQGQRQAVRALSMSFVLERLRLRLLLRAWEGK